MNGTASRNRVLLIVDPDADGRHAMDEAPRRRFGQDYTVLAVASRTQHSERWRTWQLLTWVWPHRGRA
jgi:hypothetical protein